MSPPTSLTTLFYDLAFLSFSSISVSANPLTPRSPFPKRGLPFNNPSTYIQKWNGGGSQVNWAYNWDSAM